MKSLFHLKVHFKLILFYCYYFIGLDFFIFFFFVSLIKGFPPPQAWKQNLFTIINRSFFLPKCNCSHLV